MKSRLQKYADMISLLPVNLILVVSFVHILINEKLCICDEKYILYIHIRQRSYDIIHMHIFTNRV